MGRRLCPEFWTLASLPVKNAVIGGEPCLLNNRGSRYDLLAGCARLADSAYFLITLQGYFKQLAICGSRLLADGKWAMDLGRVTPVIHRQLCHNHTTYADGAWCGSLPGQAPIGIGHIGSSDEVDAGIAAVFKIGPVHKGPDVVLGHARPQVLFQGYAGEVREVTAASQVVQFLVTPNPPDAGELETELAELYLGQPAPQIHVVIVGDGVKADQADPAAGQSSVAQFFSHGLGGRAAVPADIFDDGLLLGAGEVIVEVKEAGGLPLTGKHKPAWGLGDVVD
jgi:hypothetical protein